MRRKIITNDAFLTQNIQSDKKFLIYSINEEDIG